MSVLNTLPRRPVNLPTTPNGQHHVCNLLGVVLLTYVTHNCILWPISVRSLKNIITFASDGTLYSEASQTLNPCSNYDSIRIFTCGTRQSSACYQTNVWAFQRLWHVHGRGGNYSLDRGNRSCRMVHDGVLDNSINQDCAFLC